jgi:hypothetical protein
VVGTCARRPMPSGSRPLPRAAPTR